MINYNILPVLITSLILVHSAKLEPESAGNFKYSISIADEFESVTQNDKLKGEVTPSKAEDFIISNPIENFKTFDDFDIDSDVPSKFEFTLVGEEEVQFNGNLTYQLNPYMYGHLTSDQKRKKLEEIFEEGQSNHEIYMGLLNGTIVDNGEMMKDVKKRQKRIFCAPGCGPVNCLFLCPLFLPVLGCCPIPCVPWC